MIFFLQLFGGCYIHFRSKQVDLVVFFVSLSNFLAFGCSKNPCHFRSRSLARFDAKMLELGCVIRISRDPIEKLYLRYGRRVTDRKKRNYYVKCVPLILTIM